MGEFTRPAGLQRPLLSPDGSSYWNGNNWLPVTGLGPDGQPLPALKRPVRPAVLVLVALLVVLALLFGISAAKESDRRQRENQRVQELNCRSIFGRSDPSCPQYEGH